MTINNIINLKRCPGMKMEDYNPALEGLSQRQRDDHI